MGALAVSALTNLGCYALNGSYLIPPPYGQYGTMNRNQFRDQGFRNLDFSVTKQFKFKERFTAQFRAEFFNILNHPEFVNPAGGPGGGGATLDPTLAGSQNTSGQGSVSSRTPRPGELQPSARLWRVSCDSVGPEADFLIAPGNFGKLEGAGRESGPFFLRRAADIATEGPRETCAWASSGWELNCSSVTKTGAKRQLSKMSLHHPVK